MLALDAKAHVGQALSRLLNVADGLIGQGLRIMLLVTSNEPLSRMHPAIVRAGRCAAEVEFPPLTTSEADAWLQERGGPLIRVPATIADLHALLRGELPGAHDDPQVGFSV